MSRLLAFCLMLAVAPVVLAQTNDFQEMENPRQGLSFHQPNLALIGNDPILEMKLQFSFKYRFVERGTFDPWWLAPVNTLFFGYSQKMFWDLEEDSAPYPNNYLDSYFSPELFWLSRGMAPSLFEAQFDLRGGYQHQSNGRDEVFGRTWERIYIQPYWTWGETGDWQFVATPKLWIPFAVGDAMSDIAEYYGYGELHLKFGKHQGFAVETLLRKGMERGYGAVELTASYPIQPLNLFAVGQIFHGYGESLRLYDQETTTYRIGLAISR